MLPEITVFLLEDNKINTQFLAEIIRNQAQLGLMVIRLHCWSDALLKLKHISVNVLICSLPLRDDQGLEIIGRLFQVPIVVLTKLNEIALGVQAIAWGAQDYLIQADITYFQLE